MLFNILNIFFGVSCIVFKQFCEFNGYKIGINFHMVCEPWYIYFYTLLIGFLGSTSLTGSTLCLFKGEVAKEWINLTKSCWLDSTTSNGKKGWRFWGGVKTSTKWPWQLNLSLMQQQRRSNGIIGDMRCIVSYVSAFPETLFSILMDCHHQMKYGRSFKLYLGR